MNKNKIEKLLVKFLINQASSSELDDLEECIKETKNEQVFKTFVKANYAIDYNVQKFNSDKIKAKLLELMGNGTRTIKLKNTHQIIKYTAAAILVGIMTTTYFFKDSLFSNSQDNIPIIVNNTIEAGTDKAILTLETGDTVALGKGTDYQAKNASSNGTEIIYKNGGKSNKEVAYNYLTIPRGGQFQITLADGTRVWLNSESQLKYPVDFIDGETRRVELVYGEAYFDVSHSTAHKGSHFIVNNNNQDVEVLGTEFNIKAYKDETLVYTTLVEGKVAVTTESEHRVLKPNEQSVFNSTTKTLKINDIDTFREIAWKDGVFSFKHKSLKEIMVTLSRWYDMEVVFQNKELENVSFNGTLYKNQSIEEILTFLQNNINTYEINNKTITLK